jgi:hypothetical protein
VGSRLPVLLALFVLGLTPCASAQSSESPSHPYLLRLVHVRPTENMCVLVRGDGQYHLERDTAQKTEIFEGTLAPAELENVQHLLSADELNDLTQDKIAKPAEAQHNLQLILSVHRRGYWQNLTFPVTSSWESFHDSIVPLVQWLEDMRKVKKAVKVHEEQARNNCLPPPKLELKLRK